MKRRKSVPRRKREPTYAQKMKWLSRIPEAWHPLPPDPATGIQWSVLKFRLKPDRHVNA
jgi:hypothetical protein